MGSFQSDSTAGEMCITDQCRLSLGNATATAVASFFDVRHAISALRHLRLRSLSGSPSARVHFSDTMCVRKPQEQTDRTGGLIAITTDLMEDSLPGQLYTLFSSVGDLSCFRHVETVAGSKLLCEYHDTQAAERAVLLHGTEFESCILHVVLVAQINEGNLYSENDAHYLLHRRPINSASQSDISSGTGIVQSIRRKIEPILSNNPRLNVKPAALQRTESGPTRCIQHSSKAHLARRPMLVEIPDHVLVSRTATYSPDSMFVQHSDVRIRPSTSENLWNSSRKTPSPNKVPRRAILDNWHSNSAANLVDFGTIARGQDTRTTM